MLTRPIILLLRVSAALSLVGCAVPTTYDEVRNGSGTAIETVTPLSQAEAVARLQRAWRHCYIERGLVVSAGSQHVAVEGDAAHPIVVLRGGRNLLMLMAEFSVAQDGRTHVVTRGFEAFMDKAAQNTAAWLQDPMAPSLDMSCR